MARLSPLARAALNRFSGIFGPAEISGLIELAMTWSFADIMDTLLSTSLLRVNALVTRWAGRVAICETIVLMAETRHLSTPSVFRSRSGSLGSTLASHTAPPRFGIAIQSEGATLSEQSGAPTTRCSGCCSILGTPWHRLLRRWAQRERRQT